MILNLEHLPRVIPVGIQTESGVETIGFDLSPWMTRWPGMTFAVWPTRPGESASYIAADTKLVGNVLYWYPNAADTEKEGAGTVEVVGIGGGKCKSSGVIDTLVKKTSLDVTQETPEPMKLWADKVLQAANDVKASVDAGEGGLYIVNVERRGELQTRYADRSQEEIREAVANHKTCVLVDAEGRVCVYIGEKEYPHDPYPVCPTFVAPLEYKQWHGFTYWQMQVLPSGKIAEPGYKYARTPNPYKLAVKQGDTTVKYDGSEEVNLEIPDGIPDPGQPHMQLVSDKDGKAVWEERLAWKEVKQITFADNMAFDATDDDDADGVEDMGYILQPFAGKFEVGKIYTVRYGGQAWDCPAVATPADAPFDGVVLGNTASMGDGFDASNPDAPFAMFAMNTPMESVYGVFFTIGNPMPDAITITGESVTTKKIDPEYLPDTHKTITIMIDADGNVTSDTLFAEAWAMTTGELQGAIVVKESSAYKGTTYTTADTVAKVENEVMGNFIEIRLRQGWIDTADFADKDNVRYLMWRIDNQIVIDDKQLNALPIMNKSDALKGGYLRYNGKSWEYATIDQLKADIGHVTVRASQDVTLAISGIDKSFSDVLKALKNGAHVQLMLTRPDGFTEVYPVVGYTDTNIAFIMLPSHDTAWAIEWTESGMAKILSGND